MAAAGQVEAAALRRGKSLDLRIMGASYRSIASALHISVRTAFTDVQRELDRQMQLNSEKAEQARTLMLQRLDVAAFGLYPKVQKGSATAVMALAKIEDQRAKLLGLYAPLKIAPTTPDGSTAYQPGAMADAHAEFEAIIAGALARQQEEVRQVGSGQTEAAAAHTAEAGV